MYEIPKVAGQWLTFFQVQQEPCISQVNTKEPFLLAENNVKTHFSSCCM